MTSEPQIDSAALRQLASSVLPGQPWSAYQAAARALDRIPLETVPERLRARVAVLGSFTLDPFVPVLRVEAARAGLWLETYVAPYGQYLSELLDAGSGLYRFRPHITFLAIDGDVLWNQRWAEMPPLKSEPVVGGLLTPLFAGLDVFYRAGSGIVVMNDFVLPRRSTEGVNAFRSKGTFAHTIAHANKHLRLRLALRDDTFLFPLADVVAQVGRTHAFNWRTHYRGHVTWSDTLMAAVAERYVGFALAAMGKATKCIVLDLDNTLWGGVLGEDGPGGIALGPHLARQRVRGLSAGAARPPAPGHPAGAVQQEQRGGGAGGAAQPSQHADPRGPAGGVPDQLGGQGHQHPVAGPRAEHRPRPHAPDRRQPARAGLGTGADPGASDPRSAGGSVDLSPTGSARSPP